MSESPLYLLADIGSTTTKVIAVGRRSLAPAGNGEAMKTRAETVVAFHASPTTVEPPEEDASIGFEVAVMGLGLGLSSPFEALDHPPVMVTSSAAGGLKMLVVGLVRSITAESAEKVCMGAGGVILEVLAVDDGRTDAQRAALVRSLRPDLVLVAGGFEGAGGTRLLQLCEVLAMGAPADDRPPLIFAGSGELGPAVEDILSPYYDVRTVANLRPSADREDFAPATQAIQDLFMEHVMAHAPGYEKMSRLAHLGVIPTPAAVGRMVALLAESEEAAVAAVDIGGATTDIFSVFEGAVFRTVSANLGMSYSLGNTLVEAGVERFAGWISPPIDERTLRNIVYRKVVDPTSFPVSPIEWRVDRAGAVEALRIALARHLALTRTLAPLELDAAPGRSRDHLASAMSARRPRLRRLDLGLIIGSGGCLAHAPGPTDAADILVESLRPAGITELVLDTNSTLSHFGNLSRADRSLALSLCRRSLTRLATVVSPYGRPSSSRETLRWTVLSDGGPEGFWPRGRSDEAPPESLARRALPPGESVRLRLQPPGDLDLGAGSGRDVERVFHGSRAGLIFDTRARGEDEA